MTAALVIVAAIAALASFAMSSLPGLCRDAAMALWRRDKAVIILLAALAVACTIIGGTKARITFDAGLANDGSYVTNDVVHIAWTYTALPADSNVYIDYRLYGASGAAWATLSTTTAGSMLWHGTLADATNYEYYVYSTYVPPPPVHTNGVWLGQAYETTGRRGASAFVIINGRVLEHGEKIAPPMEEKQ